MPDGPIIEAQDAANAVVYRPNAIRSVRSWAWSRQHAVAVRHKVHRVRFAPENAVLLKRTEPVDKNLGVCPERVSGVCSLDGMLVQECDGRFDKLHVGSKEQREPGRPWLAQWRCERGRRGRAQRWWD